MWDNLRLASTWYAAPKYGAPSRFGDIVKFSEKSCIETTWPRTSVHVSANMSFSLSIHGKCLNLRRGRPPKSPYLAASFTVAAASKTQLNGSPRARPNAAGRRGPPGAPVAPVAARARVRAPPASTPLSRHDDVRRRCPP
ncbi:hypothetical protein NFJ02_11g06990 [Pycnococcus provasolii]